MSASGLGPLMWLLRVLLVTHLVEIVRITTVADITFLLGAFVRHISWLTAALLSDLPSETGMS